MRGSVIAMVESGLEALAENQTTNELLAERAGGIPRRGPHAFSSGLTALSFPRTGRFSIREVVLEGYATRQKTGISSQSAQAIFLCLRKRLSLSTHPRFIKSLEDPRKISLILLKWLHTGIEEKGFEIEKVYPPARSFLMSISSRMLV